MDDDLDAYIREHHDRYTPQALRDRLIDAGHPVEAVDAALARVGAEGRAPLGRVVVSRLVMVVLALAFIPAMLLGAAGVLFALGSSGGFGFPYGIAAAAILVAYVIVLGVGLVHVARRMRAAERPSGTWIDIAAAFGLGALVLVGASGACIAGLSIR